MSPFSAPTSSQLAKVISGAAPADAGLDVLRWLASGSPGLRTRPTRCPRFIRPEDRPGQRTPRRWAAVSAWATRSMRMCSAMATRQSAGVAVDHRGQIQVRPVRDRQVRDVADVALGGRGRGEVAAQQVGHLLGGDSGMVVRTRRRSRSPAMARAHDPGRPDCGSPSPQGGAVVELGGDPRHPWVRS